jgi:hypothetical protein
MRLYGVPSVPAASTLVMYDQAAADAAAEKKKSKVAQRRKEGYSNRTEKPKGTKLTQPKVTSGIPKQAKRQQP